MKKKRREKGKTVYIYIIIMPRIVRGQEPKSYGIFTYHYVDITLLLSLPRKR